jgi:hypothetical protein
MVDVWGERERERERERGCEMKWAGLERRDTRQKVGLMCRQGFTPRRTHALPWWLSIRQNADDPTGITRYFFVSRNPTFGG